MDRKSIRLIFLSDPDLKFVLSGIIFGIFSYFVGGFNGLLIFLFVAIFFLSFLRIEVALLSLPLFVLLDFFIKNYTFGFFGLWDEAIFLFLLLIILYRMQKEKRFTFKFTNLIYPVLAFLIAGLLSICFSKDVNLAQGIEGIRSVIQSFIFFLVVVNAKISKRASRFLLFVGIFACAISALFGIYQYIAGVAVPPNWLDKDTEVGLGTRAFSFLGSPNAFAGYSVLFAPICLGFAFKKKFNLSQKALVMLFFFTIIGGLTSTLTRAAWLAFIPSLVLFGILIKQTKIILPVVLVLIAVVFSVAPMRQRFVNLFSEQYQTKSEIGGRNYRWNLALSIFEENPIFGRGPGSYGGATAYRFQEFSGLYVDNYYFEILSNYGFVGFLVFLWLIFEIIRTIVISINRALDDDKYILYGILCGIIGFLINNFTENLWEVIPLSVSMWFVLGIAVNLSSGGDGNG
jgi:O-antigen ligase